MACQFLERTQTLAYVLILVVMPLELLELYGLRVLTLCASRTCSPNKLSSEINFIKKLASWNGFPIFALKRIIHQVLNTTDESTNNAESSEVFTFYVCMPYNSNKGIP